MLRTISGKLLQVLQADGTTWLPITEVPTLVQRLNRWTNPNVETDLTGWSNIAGNTLIRDSAWSNTGSWSVKIIPAGGDVYSFAGIAGDVLGGICIGMQVGHTYTFGATVHLAAAQTGTLLTPNARAVEVIYQVGGAYTEVIGTQAPNAAGTFRSVVTAAIPADATQAFIRLYNGSQSPSDVVWWDSLIMEEGTTDGSYFDGSTTGGAYSSYAWTGTPNASTSIAYP